MNLLRKLTRSLSTGKVTTRTDLQLQQQQQQNRNSTRGKQQHQKQQNQTQQTQNQNSQHHQCQPQERQRHKGEEKQSQGGDCEKECPPSIKSVGSGSHRSSNHGNGSEQSELGRKSGSLIGHQAKGGSGDHLGIEPVGSGGPLPRGHVQSHPAPEATAESTLDPQSPAVTIPAVATKIAVNVACTATNNFNTDFEQIYLPSSKLDSPDFRTCSESCLPTSQHSHPSPKSQPTQFRLPSHPPKPTRSSNFPFCPHHLQSLSFENLCSCVTAPQAKQTVLPSDIVAADVEKAAHINRDESDIAMQRKIWVKRPGQSATRVEVNDEDLVDNVRDMILQKYANSLGRHIDSPDITLKIVPREQSNKNAITERPLGPEESIGRTLDTFYPGGQTIDEALIIEVPQKRTPKPSPRPGNHHLQYYVPDDYRPGDGARDYFGPMSLQSPHIAHIPHPNVPNGVIPVHSMSVITTGQVPPLPSPGGQHTRSRHARPKYPRQHTSSPTVVHGSQANGIDAKSQINGGVSSIPPLPTPPPATGEKGPMPQPNRTTSPHPAKAKKKRQAPSSRDITNEPPISSKPASAGLLDGRVPPINVLLVEDNVINLKLLEQFMKKLNVRWKSAMNGKEAVNMWRKGGFHLVLMDIQLPVMNGLEATKEIRRLESVNGIGINVFGDTTSNGRSASEGPLDAKDKLGDRELFKSSVIIVALTASSLQSDRHEALAVGCNDFLTKPVNFVWMERKVTEWGCMQALIDFNGWRKWKEIAERRDSEDPEKRKQEEKEEKAKSRAELKAMFSRPPPSSTAKKESANDLTTKKDNSESTVAVISPVTSTTTSNSDLTGSRKSHKGSRSQSGNSLGTTVEVDEKDE